ncbi:MAG: hypothetical protein J7518_20440 [Nocardioidaceae bacterium]|nr:hypothetical protein [Nocardioidaceae bacterium]
MPQQPSRRDTPDALAVIRHQQSYLRSLDPGYLDGRFATPQPVRDGSLLVGSDDGGGADGAYQWQWEWGDRLTVTVAGAQSFRLSHVPDEESVFLRWHPRGLGTAGIAWPNEHFVVDEEAQVIIISDPGHLIEVNDAFSAQYRYIYDEPGQVVPEFIGVTSVIRTTTSVAIPAGTQAGDLMVLTAAAWSSASTSDPRIVGQQQGRPFQLVAWGYADGSMTPLAVNIDGAGFNRAATTLTVYRGVSVASSAYALVGANPITAPTFPNAQATIVALCCFNAGAAGTAPGDTSGKYSTDGIADDPLDSVWTGHWIDPIEQTSPPGSFTLSGSFGSVDAVTLLLAASEGGL